MRARLLRDFGAAANQVLWRGQAPLIGDANDVDQSLFAMDKWLARVDADHRGVPLPQKIIPAVECDVGSGISASQATQRRTRHNKWIRGRR